MRVGGDSIKSRFESLVNTEGIQTIVGGIQTQLQFESLVNTEGIQTMDKYLQP